MASPALQPLARLKRFWGSDGSLRRKLFDGGLWHLGGTAYSTLILIAQNLLATHFLRDSREFGMINAVLWAYTLVEVFTQSGLKMALVQHRGEVSGLVHPIWTAQLVRGAALGLGAGAVGSVLAVHYGESEIAVLAWVAALSAPLNGMAGLGPVLLLREMRFRRLAIFGCIETTLGAASACALILTLRSAWAVVLGLNTMALARIVTSYLMVRERPRLDFRWSVLRPFWSFALGSLTASILAFANDRGDDFVVGSFLGLSHLGIYHLAFLYANLPGLKVGTTLGNLLVPILSRLRENPERLRRAFGKYLAGIFLVALATFLPLVIFAPQFFSIVGRGRFLEAVTPFRILCLFGTVRFLQFSMDALFLACGRPGLWSRGQLVQALCLGAVIVPWVLRWGTTGAACAVTTASVVATGCYLWMARRLFRPISPSPSLVTPVETTGCRLETATLP